jgi:Zn-dependent protease
MLAAFMSPEAIATFLVLIVSLTVHEAAHAWLAYLGGDRTAKEQGLVTVNPIPHIKRQPMMMVVVPLLMLWYSNGRMCLGAATTPIDAEWAWRNPRRAALVSIAGPIANFVLAALAFGVISVLVSAEVMKVALLPDGAKAFSPDYLPNPTIETGGLLLIKFVHLNIFLGLLNLLPLPPLDGAGVLEGLFPRTLRPFYRMVRGNPWMMIAALAILFTQAGQWINPVFVRILRWLD